MRCRTTFVALGIALWASFASSQIRGEQGKDSMENPPYKNWASFKVGASVTLKQTIVDKSGDDPSRIDATARPAGAVVQMNTYKLILSTPQMVVVEMTQSDVEPGSEVEHAPVKVTYAAKVDQKFAEGKLPKSKVGGFKEGEEELEVAGKKIKCQWVESEIKAGNETSLARIWTSNEVPGGIVKQTTTKKQGDQVFYETTTVLTALKAERK